MFRKDCRALHLEDLVRGGAGCVTGIKSVEGQVSSAMHVRKNHHYVLEPAFLYTTIILCNKRLKLQVFLLLTLLY